MVTRRLVPRWYAAVLVAVPALMTLVMAGVTAAAGDAGFRWLAGLMTLSFAFLLVAAVTAFGRRRRERELPPDATGTVVISSPVVLAWSLVGAWLCFLAVAGLSAWLLATDFDAVESPGFTIVLVLGAIASLPDLVRLLTGRLHRWRLVLGPDGLAYAGYRTSFELPWARIHGARVNERPAGVLVDRKGSDPDPVVPIIAFPVPAEQVVAEIEQARRRHT